MTLRLRSAAAVLALASLLFGQLAVSAYACGESDFGSANLCEQHCNYGDACVDLAKGIPAAPAPAPALIVVLVEARVLLGPARAFAFGQGPAPPLIRFTVLRI